MQQEIEAKFLNTDHDALRKYLKSNGAELKHPMRLMKRAIFDYPDMRFQKNDHSEYLRVRDEGDKATITYKKFLDDSNYVLEKETTIGSFEDMVEILKRVGLKVFSYQESKRETWQFKNVEIVLDEWPWVAPMIEVEGPDEDSIKEISAELGFNWEDAVFGTVDNVYKFYFPKMKGKDSLGDLPEVKFNMPLPQYFIDRK